MPIARGCRLAATGQDARIARLGRGRLEGKAAQVFGQHECHHGFKHRHFHVLALAAAFAVKQCRQHCVDHRKPGGLVGHQGGREIGRCALMADQGCHAAGSLDHVVEGRPVGIRPVLTEAGGNAIDDFRIERCHRRIAQAQALDRRYTHVVHQHVDASQQALDRVQPGRCFEIDRQRAFVAVERQENRTHATVARDAVGAHQVAFQAFDLDHIGAKVAEDLRGQGPQHHRGQVEHAHAVQGAGLRWRMVWAVRGSHGPGVRCRKEIKRVEVSESTGRLA